MLLFTGIGVTLQARECGDESFETACAGYEKFGINPPIYIKSIVGTYTWNGDFESALEILDSAMSENPDNSILYGLRGYVYDKMRENDKSEADYRKAASLPGADYETLKNAVKKIYRIGE